MDLPAVSLRMFVNGVPWAETQQDFTVLRARHYTGPVAFTNGPCDSDARKGPINMAFLLHWESGSCGMPSYLRDNGTIT